VEHTFLMDHLFPALVTTSKYNILISNPKGNQICWTWCCYLCFGQLSVHL